MLLIISTETNVNCRKVNLQYLKYTENWLAFSHIIELKKIILKILSNVNRVQQPC